MRDKIWEAVRRYESTRSKLKLLEATVLFPPPLPRHQIPLMVRKITEAAI